MASGEPAVSFDSIIQAGRERKKAEKLATTIFGKGRRESTPNLGPRSKSSASPSLASRISKPNHRSASSSSINRVSVQTAYKKASKLNGSQKELFKVTNGHGGAHEFSIKGAAGPYVVVGSNFAPGTTAADIRSAMEPVAGDMLSCVVITMNPTVIVEMVYTEKTAAELVISTFNNQKADGRLLHLYLKQGPPTRLEAASAPAPIAIPLTSVAPPVEERSDLFSDRSGSRPPRHQTNGMAEPDYQDGRYGFEAKQDEAMDVDYQAESEENRRNYQDNQYSSERRDLHGYRQDFARGSNPRSGGYNARGSQSRPDRRPQYHERLYSDSMYSRSRGDRYR